MDLSDIQQILSLMRDHDLAEFEIEREGFKLRIRKGGAAVTFVPPATSYMPSPPVPVPVAAAEGPSGVPSPGAGPEDADAVNLGVIKSPIVGTFYRAAEPGAPPFVEVGATVKKGQVLCIIEAMKLMNEIESDCDGEIVKVYVENGKPVQFGERLFAVKVS